MEWREKLSSIWSRKPMPVSMSDSPVPSRSRETAISVSRVLRSTVAVRMGILQFGSSITSSSGKLKDGAEPEYGGRGPAPRRTHQGEGTTARCGIEGEPAVLIGDRGD